MNGSFKINEHGKIRKLNLFFAKEIEDISEKEPSDFYKSLIDLLESVLISDGKSACKELIISLSLNKPECFRSKEILSISGDWGKVSEVVFDNIDYIIDYHRYDAVALDSFISIAAQNRKVDLLRKIFFLKEKSTIVQITRTQVFNDLLSITPTIYSNKNNNNNKHKHVKRKLIITDRSVDPEFIINCANDANQTTIHYYSDLNGDANNFDIDVDKNVLIGCREIIPRYSDIYTDLHNNCCALVDEIVNEISLDKTLNEKIPLDGLLNSLSLLMCDRIFYGMYNNACVFHLIDFSKYDEINFLLGKNESLWSISEIIAARNDSRIKFSAPSFIQANRQNAAQRLKGLSCIKSSQYDIKNNNDFNLSGDDDFLKEVDRRMRFFAHCALYSASAHAKSIRLPHKNKNVRIFCVGGKYPAYFEGLATVYNLLNAKDGVDTHFCHLGLDPEYSRDEIFKNAKSLNGERAVSVSNKFIDFYTPQKSEPVYIGLGRWLFKKKYDSVHKKINKLNKDSLVGASLYLAALDRMEHIFNYDVGPFIGNVMFYKKVIQDSKPDLLVVSPSRSSDGMAFCAVASSLGIKTYALDVHILDAKYPRNIKIYTNRVGVISEYFAEEYSDNFGISKKNIDVVGSIRLAKMISDLDGVNVIDVKKSLGLRDSKEKVILIATQPIKWDVMEDCFRSIIKGISSISDVRIILKTHREESSSRLKRYISILNEFGLKSVEIDQSTSIQKLILVSNCVVTFYSTTAMEAAVIGRPVVIMQPKIGCWPTDWAEMGFALSARNSIEITESIIKSFNSPIINNELSVNSTNLNSMVDLLFNNFVRLINDDTVARTGDDGGIYVENSIGHQVIG